MEFVFSKSAYLPNENEWKGNRRAGEGGSIGPDTREVRDTLASTGLNHSRSFRSPKRLTRHLWREKKYRNKEKVLFFT